MDLIEEQQLLTGRIADHTCPECGEHLELSIPIPTDYLTVIDFAHCYDCDIYWAEREEVRMDKMSFEIQCEQLSGSRTVPRFFRMINGSHYHGAEYCCALIIENELMPLFEDYICWEAEAYHSTLNKSDKFQLVALFICDDDDDKTEKFLYSLDRLVGSTRRFLAEWAERNGMTEGMLP